MNNPEKLAT